MAKPELLSAINALSRKIDTLMEIQKTLTGRIAELETENKILSAQNIEDKQKLEEALKKIEFLSVSHRLAASPEALVSARNNIHRLIRTIDSCIRMLNED